MNELVLFNNRVTKDMNTMFDNIEDMFFGGLEIFRSKIKDFSLPYNIYKDKKNNAIFVEMAVAGYSKDDLVVDFSNGVLNISGKNPLSNQEVDFIYKGLQGRSFSYQLPVAPIYTLDSAELKNGLLKIKFNKTEQKLNKIDIKTAE